MAVIFHCCKDSSSERMRSREDQAQSLAAPSCCCSRERVDEQLVCDSGWNDMVDSLNGGPQSRS